MRKEIEIPKVCPACSSKTELINEQLFCTNYNCSVVVSKKLLHFAKVMGIKGLGEKTLEKLGIQDISTLYTLTEEEIQFKLDSKLLGTKLYNSIQQSKTCTIDTLLTAFCIPLVGMAISKKIAPFVDNIPDITKDICLKAKVGEKATVNILNFIRGEYEEALKTLPVTIIKENSIPKKNNLGIVCITGKISDLSKKEATDLLEAKGYTVVDNVTKNTTILVDEVNNNSTKRQRAESLNIKIINNIKDLL